MLRINTDETPKQVTKDPKRHETGRNDWKNYMNKLKGYFMHIKIKFH